MTGYKHGRRLFEGGQLNGKVIGDVLTNDDDQDSGYYLENQGKGDERQDGDIVPEERGGQTFK